VNSISTAVCKLNVYIEISMQELLYAFTLRLCIHIYTASLPMSASLACIYGTVVFDCLFPEADSCTSIMVVVIMLTAIL